MSALITDEILESIAVVGPPETIAGKLRAPGSTGSPTA